MSNHHHRHPLRARPRRARRPGRPGRRFSARHAVVGVAAALGTSACASGESILRAGNDPTTTDASTTTTPAGTIAVPTTMWLGEATAPTTAGAVPTTVQLVPTATTTTTAPTPTTIRIVPPESGASRPSGFAHKPGATSPLAGSTDFADCPVDALDDADGPVRIEFWHTMQSAQGEALTTLADRFNSSQDRIVVELQNQNGYEELIDKYFQSSHEDRPHMVQMPEYMLQQMADANTVVTTTACIQRSGYDISPFLQRAMFAYQTGGVQWAMPFNVSTPVLYYNQSMFEEAGLDPDQPPVTLDQLREYSQQIVDSGAATYGIALDSGINSGGGWFLEQWLARAGLPYADNDNGRTARASRVTWNTPETVEMLTFAQELVEDGLAFYVGEDPRGIDGLLRMADPEQPAAMTIATSGALGGVLDFVEGGAIAGITSEDVGVGPMPGPSDTPSAIVGGAALYIVRDRGDAEAAAAWEFIQYLMEAESQSYWSATSGYAPIRDDATEVGELALTLVDDPRFRVAYEQVNFGADDFSAVGPVLGPMRQVRQVTARMMAEIYNGADVETALAEAEEQANLLIADYDSRN